ncbi:MAG TPA: YkgJ family cysteine cluster protein [Candidatus Saccharimonadales bacterium]|nr:YkgJ family cysteine cluster protein [Candidatus Saccharimonadales bacterium]
MSGEVSCQNCRAACCKGRPALIMQLSPAELEFMRASGNILQPIEEPVDYDREDARYPIGIASVDNERRTIRWLFEAGRETEPLPSGMGRYALLGTCKYLETDEAGWERCSVYEDRPQVCRDFEEGSDKCLLLRKLEGLD